MDRIEAFDDRALSKSTKIAALILGIGLIVFAFFSEVKYSALIGVILLLTVIMDKKTFVTKKGIEVQYDFIVGKHVISWSFDEITDIHIEDVTDGKHLILHFLKNVMSRRLVFDKEEGETILLLAQSSNEKINVDYVN